MIRLAWLGCVLLLLLLGAVWIRSYWFFEAVEVGRQDAANDPRGDWSVLVTTTPGQVRICWPSPEVFTWDGPRSFFCMSSTRRFNGGGYFNSVELSTWKPVAYGSDVNRKSKDYGFCAVRLWLACSLAGAWPIFFAVFGAWRRARRGKRGLCVGCGYDLCASPEQCPECGRRAVPVWLKPRMKWPYFRIGMVALLIAYWVGAASMIFAGRKCGWILHLLADSSLMMRRESFRIFRPPCGSLMEGG